MEDPFLMEVVVLVDEATEPGVNDEEAGRKREQLTSIMLNRRSQGADMSNRMSNVSGGTAVAFALRKRLKSGDEVAVLNTLTLLDELMRTCPYFYRYVANEKFFRRMWRFVVPDYKSGVKSMIPLFNKGKISSGTASGGEATMRVLTLIRAWAEELSLMFNNRYDPDAGFLIERYNNKRYRVSFPELPKTSTPWVCPVNTNRRGGSSRVAGSSRGRPVDETIRMSLDEVENTVSLFANLVDEATSVDDLKKEACSEMAERCTEIKNNLSRMSMNMNEEEELARAIAVSETLERTLGLYNSSLEDGELVSSVPPIDSTSLNSEDERYDVATSSRSMDLYNSAPRDSFPRENIRGESRFRDPFRQSGRYSESPEVSEGERGDWTARDPDHNRERVDEIEHDHLYYRRPDTERMYRSRHEVERPYRLRDRSSSPRPLQRESDRDLKRPSRMSNEKRTRREDLKPSMRRRQKSDSVVPELVKQSKKKTAPISKKDDGLIELPEEEEDVYDEDVDQGNDAAFTMLAERYSQLSTKKSKSKSLSSRTGSAQTSGQSSSGQSLSPQNTNATGSSTQSVLPMPNLSANPAAFYQSMPGMAFNPMMMMQNPYAMYGSVSPMPFADRMAMYSAYQTVNPAMYYASVNPGIFPPPSMQMMPSTQTPGMQSTPSLQNPAPQATLQSPSVRSNSHRSQSHNVSSPNSSQSSQQHSASGLAQSPQPQADTSGVTESISQRQQVALNSAGTHFPMAGQSQMSLLYGSVSGQNPMMIQGNTPFNMPPGQTQMGSRDSGTMNGVQPQMQPFDTEAQAAVYQNAMQQAAVAYHTAASAYRTIQGHAPVQASSSAMASPPNSATEQKTAAQREGQ